MHPITRTRTPKRVRIASKTLRVSGFPNEKYCEFMDQNNWATSMKAKIKRSTYVLLPGRLHLRYCDIGHYPGGILWFEWRGRLRSVVSTGAEYHHDLDGRVNMDLRWRGRLDNLLKIGTMMPPLDLYTVVPERIPLPGWIIFRLKCMGAVVIYVDTATGMHKVIEAADRGKL